MLSRKKIYFFILIIILVMPISSKAACSIEEKAKLKQIVSNVNMSYNYEIKNNSAVFSIKFNNVNSQIYFKDKNGNSYYGNENGEVILYNYNSGKSYSFDFYGTQSCMSESVGKLYTTLPTYNPYYKLNVCDDAKEYKLCQKWVSHSLGRNEFIEKVNEYKNVIKNKIDDSDIDKKISVIDFTLSFIRMYGIYILIVVSILIITIKYIRYKKDSFGF